MDIVIVFFLILSIFIFFYILYKKNVILSKLEKIDAFNKVLLKIIESPILLQNKEKIIVDTNLKFCDLIGVKYSDLIGNNLEDFYNTGSNTNTIIDIFRQLKKKTFEKVQVTIQNANLDKKKYILNQTIYEDGIVTIFTDITKEKKLELEKIKDTQYMIQQSKLAEIGELFSSIAHQWKTPLVEITALAQDMFFLGGKEEKEEESYHINNIMIQARYMTSTINDFQNFIMPSKYKVVFNVHKSIKSILNIVKHNMKYNYIDVKILASKSDNLNIYGYENEFMQAILNIMNNAKDALLNNDKKNRTICIKIKKRLNIVILDIIDNGYGISKDIYKKIFLQYFSTKENGHGIGLYMSRLIIQDRLGGSIKYKSMNSGSCFRIKLRVYNENIAS